MDKQRPSPPSWSTKFLGWFIKKEYFEDIQGDLEEEFQLITKGNSIARARSWYTWQIIRLFRPEMIKKVEAQDHLERESTMYKNYLKIGIRNLKKYFTSTLINIIGLSTGIAAFVLIALFVIDEYSYDRHHKHAENIYRVTVKNFDMDGNLSRQWAFASAGHADRLKEDYSEITHATRFYAWAFPDLNYQDKKFPSEQVVFADDDVFDIFSFPFLLGSPENAFTDVFSIVLTEASAIKIFGQNWQDQDLLGTAIELSRDGQKAPFKVTGVIANMPEQQHFHFEYLAPIRFIEQLFGEESVNNVGGNYNWLTYVRVSPGTDIRQLTKNANAQFWDKYIGEIRAGFEARDFYDFVFQPMLDIHLTSNLEGEIENNGSLEQVLIFSGVGILLLLVACVNYMNIATSHFSRRMKEIGVRKVIGAQKSALVKQFLTESLLVTLLSLPIAILLIYWALPYLNTFMEKNLIFNPIISPQLILGLLLLMVLVGVLAGFYPALFLSRMNLIQSLKGEQVVNAKKWNFRSWLVTFQYAVTIALIFAIGVIESQMQYIRNADPGFDREMVLSLRLPRGVNFQTFKNELLEHPNILKASYSTRIPTGRLSDSWGSRFFKGDSAVASNFRLPIVSVDRDFLDTYDIPLIAGEPFSEGMKTTLVRDTVMLGHYIINETAAKAYGFDNPQDIIGKKMGYGPTEGRIVGVMGDFHFESLHSPIVPMLILYSENYRRISLKLKPTDISSTLVDIESIYAQFDQESSARYQFVDELFNDQYQKEQRLGTMIKVFAVIAILIGCLGMIGMVGFVIETKLKEIGVRKVLGATTTNIWVLISNRFMILILIAFTLALPLAYWLMSGWLENFVYRTNISIFLILLPAFLVGIITMLMISYQTYRASIVNPVECLQDE